MATKNVCGVIGLSACSNSRASFVSDPPIRSRNPPAPVVASAISSLAFSFGAAFLPPTRAARRSSVPVAREFFQTDRHPSASSPTNPKARAEMTSGVANMRRGGREEMREGRPDPYRSVRNWASAEAAGGE